MSNKDLTAYCGLYCPDCMWYQNNFSSLARDLMDKLNQVNFKRYASVKSPFGTELEYYSEFSDILKFIARNDCKEPCRTGGGCGGHPCKIMKCAEKKNYEGCWECSEMEACEKFDIVTPRCGDTPVRNLQKIKELGYEGWVEERDPYYIWQRQDKNEIQKMKVKHNPQPQKAKALLEESGLPVSDLNVEHFEHFLYLGEFDNPSGIIGLEIFDSAALLRSLAVSKNIQGKGYGESLVLAMEDYAKSKNIKELYLLTETAENFFNKLNYDKMKKETAPESIRDSSEFSSVCPESAVLMMKRL